MDLKKKALKLHAKHRGKLATEVTIPIKNISDMVLAYTPGVFKGALSVRAKKVTEKMKIKAAEKLASLVKNPTTDKIVVSMFDKGVTDAVAKAVAGAA